MEVEVAPIKEVIEKGPSSNAPAVERLLAGLVDVAIIWIIGFIPVIGWVCGIAYFITRDALPFLDGQSMGKKLFKLRVVKEFSGEPIKGDYACSMVRSITLLLPIFNIFDAIKIFSKKYQRYGDEWAKTIVIKEKV